MNMKGDPSSKRVCKCCRWVRLCYILFHYWCKTVTLWLQIHQRLWA
jgi:hypothetical protein